MRTRREVLIDNGWKPLKGFCFPTPNSGDDYDNTFVSEEDALPVIAKGVQEYWLRSEEWDELIYKIDEAWEHFLDDYHDDNGHEFQEEVEK